MRYPLTLPVKAIHPDTRQNLPEGLTHVDLYPKGYHDKRTNPQNRLYRSWLNIISQHTGHTDDELHELFKHLFLSSEVREIMGVETTLYPTTTKLNKKEFTVYLEKIEYHIWHELTVVLPHPNENKIKHNTEIHQ